MEIGVAGRIAERATGVLLQARSAHPHIERLARPSSGTLLRTGDANVRHAGRAIRRANAATHCVKIRLALGVPESAAFFAALRVFAVALVPVPNHVASASPVRRGLQAVCSGILIPRGARLPTHRANSVKAGVTFVVAEQSVTLQASRTSVGLARAVPVALSPAEGQIDRSSLGSDPCHHLIYFSGRKRGSTPINLAFRHRRAYRGRHRAHRKKGEKRHCQRFANIEKPLLK